MAKNQRTSCNFSPTCDLFLGDISIFSNRYVGVDVFFAISCYFITTVFLNNLQASRFRLLSFYERRVRRILLALTFVVLCCLQLAWFMLMPGKFVDFAQSKISVTAFSSNSLFMKRVYFRTSSELLSILHI